MSDLNDGHIHEVIDRIYMTQEFIDMALVKHPLIESNPDWQSRLDDAQKVLGDLYQKVAEFDSIIEISESKNA